MLKHQDILNELTLEEKAALCDGANFWYLKSVERLGLPGIMVSDGPHGLRKQAPDNQNVGFANSVPAVCFPTACTTACSWDPDLLYEMGEALGDTCLSEKVSVLLGPGINMKRSPLCGRNFEYFSEDPYLAGEIATAFVEGVQSKGVGTSLKHFAGNNQETRRFTVDSVIDERALREIYLAAFEKVIKKAKPWTVMCAYNRLNGTYCSENKYLLNDILRDEWGYDGLVVSDWGAVNNRTDGVPAGNDLEMPSSAGINTKKIIAAVEDGSLSEEDLDKRVDNIVELIIKGRDNLKGYHRADKDEQHALARRIASESMVLLKNDDSILPLKSGAKITVIGEMAVSPRYQGNGSSLINAFKIDNALDCLLDEGFDVKYVKGYSKKKDVVDPALMHEAVSAANDAETVIIFAGLTEDYEAEGYDRKTMNLPRSQNELIKAVSAVNDKVIVVLAGGAPVTIPWLGGVKALLHSGLGGEAGAGAVADILSGKVNPSGKLAETYPICNNCTPCRRNFPGNRTSVEYRESIFIGYRYYETAKKKVRFPFGYGLSYTEFEYSDLKLDKKEMDDSEILAVSFRIKNVGEKDGAEIAQVYVSDKESTVFRPAKELKAFKKVFLKAGEEKEITLELDKRSFAYYNINIADWHVETGEFIISVGASVEDIKLTDTVKVNSTAPDVSIPDYRQTAPDYYSAKVADIDKEQFEAVLGHEVPTPNSIGKDATLDLSNCIEDADGKKWGRRINGAIDFMSSHMNSEAAALYTASAKQMPIKNIVYMSNGVVNEEMAEGILKILNDDKPGKGAKMLAKGMFSTVKNAAKFLKSI
ncbi:MAG: glycoside hydrolase family 3 C-terminal domain-containing protein [Clostridiales bacterium]|nr:glycoside hydrolase family 3 C-terminal domain-containing protein [Clostridiales bacterium]